MRLAGQAKMGFYPTPLCVIDALRKILVVQGETRYLDTCCGDGEPLSLLADGYEGCSTYGIELDENRAAVAEGKLDAVLRCDSIYETRISRAAFGVLLLNPPYDDEWGDVDDEKIRVEARFLHQHFTYLAPKGVLIYIIPWSTVKKVKKFLIMRLENPAIFAFPGEEFDRFKQVVIMGQRPKGPFPEEIYKSNKDFWDAVTSVPVEDVQVRIPQVDSEEFYRCSYPVPVIDRNEKTFMFKSTRFDPDKAYTQVQDDGLMDTFLLETKIQTMSSLQPLTPLRNGHMAMLLASGMMNGMVGKDDRKFLIKGSVRKYQEETGYEDAESDDDSDGGTKVAVIERFEIIVRALDYQTKSFIDIK